MEGAELLASYFDDRSSLIKADLTRARLNGADLTDTTLSEAHGQSKVELVYYNKVDWLSRVKLIGANLTGADLNGVDLTGANLNGACLAGVKNWDKANWEGVRNWRTARLPVGLREHLKGLAATSEHRF